MALRILTLVCSMIVPAAPPSHRDTLPVGQPDPPRKSSGVSPADSPSHPLAGPSCKSWPARGRFRSLAGYPEDLLRSPQAHSDVEEDEGELDLPTLAFTVRQAGGIDPAIFLFFPAHPCPRAARFSSWRIPLRC